MEYCKKCGLPSTYRGIRIGENGVCNFCDFYDAHSKRLRDHAGLEAFFAERAEAAKEEAKRRGSKFDCVAGLSGGKDSTYVIYQLKHKYGLRVLAFTLDNGFSTPFGVNNVKNALDRLGVEHVRITPDDEILRKFYEKSLQLLKNFCGVCFHLMHYYSYLLASQYDIPLIVNGRTRSQILQSAAAEKGIEPFEISHSLKEFEYQMFGRLVDKLDGYSCIDLLHGVEAEELSYFMYHKVSDEEVLETLERETGWVRPQSNIPHADCWAHPMAEHLSIRKFGYPVRTGEMGVLVREGEVTKEEAAAILEKDMSKYSQVDSEMRERFEERTRQRKGRPA